MTPVIPSPTETPANLFLVGRFGDKIQLLVPVSDMLTMNEARSLAYWLVQYVEEHAREYGGQPLLQGEQNQSPIRIPIQASNGKSGSAAAHVLLASIQSQIEALHQILETL